jgi:hypothetical protein
MIPMTEEVITIRPSPCGSIAGSSNIVSWCAPKKLAENCASICWRLMVAAGHRRRIRHY